MRCLTPALAIAALLIVGLSGCVPSGSANPEPSTTPRASATSTPTPEPTPAAAEPATGYTSTPVDIDCDALVNRQAVYDYNPNYGLEAKFTAAAGSDAATIVANQGVACSWLNQTSGETFVIAVAQLAPSDLSSLQADLATSSTPASGLGDAAFFTATGGVGVAQVFSGPYWIVASSPAFYEIAEPQPLLTTALAALGQ